MMRPPALLRAASLALTLACLTTPLPATLAAANPPPAATLKVSTLSFTKPDAWKSIEVRSQMRKAQLEVPNAAGSDTGEVVFFHFGPNDGGGTQANVERWFRQFQGTKDQVKARTEDAKAGSAKVTYVFAEGTYMSGMPGGPQTPKANYALAGAIIEDPAGAVFVKYTGPKTLVQGTLGDFRKLVESARH